MLVGLEETGSSQARLMTYQQRPQRSEQAKAYRKWYDLARWRHPVKGVRARRLRLEPLCRTCKKAGRVTIATVCDHVAPHKGDPDLFWSLSNTQSLCAPCHDGTKQSIERGGQTIGIDGWPVEEEAHAL